MSAVIGIPLRVVQPSTSQAVPSALLTDPNVLAVIGIPLRAVQQSTGHAQEWAVSSQHGHGRRPAYAPGSRAAARPSWHVPEGAGSHCAQPEDLRASASAGWSCPAAKGGQGLAGCQVSLISYVSGAAAVVVPCPPIEL